jgi:GT2 family glycosyltransferase
MPKVAIIYLAYKTEEYIRDVVNAIENLNYPREDLALVLVPNGSPDGVLQIMQDEIIPRSGVDLPEIKLFNDGVNRGFAGGNNHGMQWAIDQGFDYVLLNNGDLTLTPDAITNLVKHLEEDKTIASAQPLVVYWKDHEMVNVSGGMFHIAGYGYARDNRKQVSEIGRPDGDDVLYASCAAGFFRIEALKEVGLLEEGFFMYHEDLELGLRLRMAGHRNILCTESLAYHDYSFSRNPKKFAWIELYRYVVVFAYYRPLTLLLIVPLLVCIEIGTWGMAAMGKWLPSKLWANTEALKPRTWKLLFSMRKRAQKLRKVKDADLLKFVNGSIEDQEVMSSILVVANKVIEAWLKIIRRIVIW